MEEIHVAQCFETETDKAETAVKLAKGLSCLDTSLAGADVPDGYLLASLGTARTMATVDAGHEAYDAMVQTARPLVLEFVEFTDLGPYSYKADLVDAQRICAAPSHVSKGSRVPSESNSLGRDGTRQGWLLTGALALAVLVLF